MLNGPYIWYEKKYISRDSWGLNEALIQEVPYSISRISRTYTMKHAPLRASKQEFYWPISFSVNLIEFDTFVHNPIFAFGCLVTGNRNPYLIVNHPHQKERECEKVEQVCFAFSLDYHWVCAMNHPWDQNHILPKQRPKRKLKKKKKCMYIKGKKMMHRPRKLKLLVIS